MSLASFRPRPVIALTSLITLIFWSPTAVKTTSKASFSSAASAAGAAPPAATATGAAAVTPHFYSKSFESSAASITVSVDSSSTILFKSAIFFVSP